MLQPQKSALRLLSFIQSPGLTSICSIFITHLSLRAPSINSSSESSPRGQHMRLFIVYSQGLHVLKICTTCREPFQHLDLSPAQSLTFRKLQHKLTISIFINQLEYPVHHLVRSEEIAVFIQLSVAGFLQSINRLRVTGQYVTRSPTLRIFYHSPLSL